MLEISPEILKTNSHLHVFLFTVHDWVSYLTHQPYWWNDYDTSLQEVLYSKCRDDIHSIIAKPKSMSNLLYRHMVVKSVVYSDIIGDYNSSCLYSLMGSMLIKDPVFSSLDHQGVWKGIEEDVHPINRFRLNQPLIQEYLHELSMREDVTDDRLIKDHALLSSLSLLYGLYLIYVILIYENTVRPQVAVRNILKTITHTLIQLKGELFNVEK